MRLRRSARCPGFFDFSLFQSQSSKSLGSSRGSVTTVLKAELLDDTAAEAYNRLRERYASSGVAAYCAVAQRWWSLRQGQSSIQDYIVKFDSLSSEFEAAASKVSKEMKMGIFVAGLEQSLDSSRDFREVKTRSEQRIKITIKASYCSEFSTAAWRTSRRSTGEQ